MAKMLALHLLTLVLGSMASNSDGSSCPSSSSEMSKSSLNKKHEFSALLQHSRVGQGGIMAAESTDEGNKSTEPCAEGRFLYGPCTCGGMECSKGQYCIPPTSGGPLSCAVIDSLPHFRSRSQATHTTRASHSTSTNEERAAIKRWLFRSYWATDDFVTHDHIMHFREAMNTAQTPGAANEVSVQPKDGCNMEKLPDCPPDYASVLQSEVAEYERSQKFQNKIEECGKEDQSGFDGRFQDIFNQLDKIVANTHSVLDLGGACGTIGRRLRKLTTGRVAIVELVPGWVEAGKKLVPSVEFYNADATNFTLTETGLDHEGVPIKFDVISMADSFEHVPAYRKEALWESIRKHSKEGTRLYIHIPTPAKQQQEQAAEQGGHSQYFEEIIQYDTTEQQGRCLAGFRLDSVIEAFPDYASLLFTKQGE